MGNKRWAFSSKYTELTKYKLRPGLFKENLRYVEKKSAYDNIQAALLGGGGGRWGSYLWDSCSLIGYVCRVMMLYYKHKTESDKWLNQGSPSALWEFRKRKEKIKREEWKSVYGIVSLWVSL